MTPIRNFVKNAGCIILALSASTLFAQQSQNNVAFNTLLNDYYEEGLKLNPIAATAAGDPRYNDLLPNSISVSHLQKVHEYNTKYQKLLGAFKRASLNSFDKIAFDIISLQTKQALVRE